MKVLADADIASFPNRDAVEAMRRAVLLHESGQLQSPPRLHAADLTFTVGGSAEAFGFRAYHTRDTAHDEQLVAVWDETGKVAGVIVGTALGPLRTAALGALATDVMSRPDVTHLGIIGSGKQARAHALAVACVRNLQRVMVYSRQRENREKLAAELRAAGLNAEAVASAKGVCGESDLLTLATNSPTPVIQADWVRPGTHICTLGPKEQHRHEFPPELAEMAALVVTDSSAQLRAYSGGHVLAGETVRSLGDCVLNGIQRQPQDITLFLSVGLAGTEVLLAQEILASS